MLRAPSLCRRSVLTCSIAVGCLDPQSDCPVTPVLRLTPHGSSNSAAAQNSACRLPFCCASCIHATFLPASTSRWRGSRDTCAMRHCTPRRPALSPCTTHHNTTEPAPPRITIQLDSLASRVDHRSLPAPRHPATHRLPPHSPQRILDTGCHANLPRILARTPNGERWQQHVSTGVVDGFRLDRGQPERESATAVGSDTMHRTPKGTREYVIVDSAASSGRRRVVPEHGRC